MTATAGPTNVTVGDPITVRVQISGRGALDAVTLPAQEAWNNFKTYPPTTKLETSDQFWFSRHQNLRADCVAAKFRRARTAAARVLFFQPGRRPVSHADATGRAVVVHAAGTSPMPVLAANSNPAPQ